MNGRSGDQTKGLGLPQRPHQRKDSLLTPKDRKLMKIMIAASTKAPFLLILSNDSMKSIYYYSPFREWQLRARI